MIFFGAFKLVPSYLLNHRHPVNIRDKKVWNSVITYASIKIFFWEFWCNYRICLVHLRMLVPFSKNSTKFSKGRPVVRLTKKLKQNLITFKSTHLC